MLSIQNLTKTYRGNKKAVDNLSIDIEQGNLLSLSEQAAVVKQPLYV